MGDDERVNTTVDKIIIISIPEKDDPSQFKTVSTYTFPNTPDPPFENRYHLSYFTPRSFSSYLPSRKSVLFALAFAFSFFYILGFVSYPHSPFEYFKEKSENRRDDEKSILFNLYPKYGGGENRTRLMSTGSMKIQSDSVKRLKNDASVVMPLKGNVFPDGQYYTSIFIGNPPRPYFLDVDTGSDLTWIQCDAPCTSCAKGPHPLYKPSKGKIVQPKDSLCRDLQHNLNNKHCDSCKQCDYNIEYADRSSSMGVLAKDDMHLFMNSKTKFDIVFGCGYDQRGNLLASPAKTDGILGLSTAKVSLPTQLADKGIIKNVVGHCITSEARGGGYMFFGDDFVPSWGMTWVPTSSNFLNLYVAEAHKLGYGDQHTSINEPVVFDTGSSYTIFPEGAYSSLIANIDNSISGILDRDYLDTTVPVCWHASHPLRSVNEVKRLFQPITLQFAKSWWMMPRKFAIPPEGYLIISDKGNLCLGILNGSIVHDGSSAIILGDVSLRGKLIIYDNIKQKIGWTSSGCVKPQKESMNYYFFF